MNNKPVKSNPGESRYTFLLLAGTGLLTVAGALAFRKEILDAIFRYKGEIHPQYGEIRVSPPIKYEADNLPFYFLSNDISPEKVRIANGVITNPYGKGITISNTTPEAVYFSAQFTWENAPGLYRIKGTPNTSITIRDGNVNYNVVFSNEDEGTLLMKTDLFGHDLSIEPEEKVLIETVKDGSVIIPADFLNSKDTTLGAVKDGLIEIEAIEKPD